MSIYAEVLKFKVILNTSLASGVASSSSVSVSLIDSETGKQREIDDEAIIPIIFEKNNEKYESMLMTVNSTTGSLSDVDFVRGIDGDGYLVAGDTDLALQWESGSEGGCKTNSLNSNRTRQIWLGNLRSGGNTTIIGDGTASNQSIKRENDVGEYEWLRFNDTTGKAQFSNDGSSFVNFDNAGVGALAAARMIDSTALGLGNVQVNDNYATATGIVNTFAVTITGLTTPYVLGEKVRFKANLANTGACTIAVNGGAAKTIKRFNGTTDLSAGDIPNNAIVEVVYDGTNYQLCSNLPVTEQEILTVGETSDASDLHYHPAKIFQGHGTATESETIVLTHNLGVIPKSIKINAVCNGALKGVSFGMATTNTDESCIYYSTNWALIEDYITYLDDGGATKWTGIVGNFTDSVINYVVVMTGVPGDFDYQYTIIA